MACFKKNLGKSRVFGILFSLFIAPKYWGIGNKNLRPCIPLAVYCVKLVVSDRKVANKVNIILDKLPGKSYK